MLSKSVRNLTFAISPSYYETYMHNDETHSLVHSLTCHKSVKIWFILPNGIKDINEFNNIFTDKSKHGNVQSLIEKYTSLHIVVQLPGMTVFNPYTCSHAVITYGVENEQFWGIAVQVVTKNTEKWKSHLATMIFLDMVPFREIRTMIEKLKGSKTDTLGSIKVLLDKMGYKWKRGEKEETRGKSGNDEEAGDQEYEGDEGDEGDERDEGHEGDEGDEDYTQDDE